jgi:hypothetical protein
LLNNRVADEMELVADVVAHHSADANAARFREPLQPRGDIHAVAEDVVLFRDHVTKVDANAEPDPAFFSDLGLAVDHPPLNLDGAADGVHYAPKLRQEAVASVLDDPPTVLGDIGIDQLAEMHLEPLVRPFFVSTHQPRIPRLVGGEDRGEAADGSHHSRQPALRRPLSI